MPARVGQSLIDLALFDIYCQGLGQRVSGAKGLPADGLVVERSGLIWHQEVPRALGICDDANPQQGTLGSKSMESLFKDLGMYCTYRNSSPRICT